MSSFLQRSQIRPPYSRGRIGIFELSLFLFLCFIKTSKAQYRNDFDTGGSSRVPKEDLVYGLGPKGIRYLHKQGSLSSARMHEKEVREIYLEHTLLIADFMVRMETELPPGVSLLYEDRLVPGHIGPISWRVPIVCGSSSGEDVTQGGGYGLFLFTDLDSCRAAESLLLVDWTLGNGLYSVKLIS